MLADTKGCFYSVQQISDALHFIVHHKNTPETLANELRNIVFDLQADNGDFLDSKKNYLQALENVCGIDAEKEKQEIAFNDDIAEVADGLSLVLNNPDVLPENVYNLIRDAVSGLDIPNGQTPANIEESIKLTLANQKTRKRGCE